jgi:hypothetical protein
MKKIKQELLGIAVFLSVTLVALLYTLNFHFDAEPSHSYRNPANTVEIEDYQDLNDQNILSQIKTHILRGLRVIELKDYSGIELGGFMLLSPSGENVFACDEFPKITFIFEGEGVAYSGAKPQMEISGPCIKSPSGQIEALLIPNYELSQKSPFQGDFPVPNSEALIRFYNTNESWPNAWSLTAIYFENHSGVTQIEITLSDLIEKIGRPVGITWPTHLDTK